MKKVLVIPDIHGEKYWRKSIDLINQYDRIIFLGDYLDAWEDLGITDQEMLDNLQDIILFKKSYDNKVVLLLGNHELSYMFNDCICSGYRPFGAVMFNSILHRNINEFKIVYKEDDFLFSHAGITKGWYEYNKDELEKYGENIIDQINNIFLTNKYPIIGQVSSKRGGNYKYGSPTWADMQETATGGILKNYHQVVGHTPTKNKNIMFRKFTEQNSSILFCDCHKIIELDIKDNDIIHKIIEND